MLPLLANYITLNKYIEEIDKETSQFISMIQTEHIKIEKTRKKIRKEKKELLEKKLNYALKHERSLLAIRVKYLTDIHISYITQLMQQEVQRQDILRRIAEKKEQVRKQNRLLAKIDISKQRMLVYKGNKLLYTWKISSGKQGHATPRGKYKAMYTVKKYRSKKYNNALMPYAVFFRYGYAIHATNSVKRLGRRASHGCIRLHTQNAKKFYTLVRKIGKNNTIIRIIN